MLFTQKDIMEGFKELNIKELKDNIFKLFNDDWTLITAGTSDSFNTMTASWGTMGILWNRQIAICFIRPQRYTHQFTEKSSFFTLSFFEEEHREILKFCGANSGRDFDKIKETGLIPVATTSGNIGFKQAKLVLECRKLYSDNLKPDNFIVKEIIGKNYPKADFHRFYIGEIEKCYLRLNSTG
jgi:flavin reductase (DIM6/NTAB) family NADH-FMN oxidoreductase RutF